MSRCPESLAVVYERFVEQLRELETDVDVVFGDQTTPPTRPSRYPRILFIPGDGIDVGEFLAPKYPGGNERSLGMLHERFTLHLESVDPSAPQDKIRQYNAARALLSLVYQAFSIAFHGVFAFTRAEWNLEKTLVPHGTLIKIFGYVESILPDAPVALVTATSAELDTLFVVDSVETELETVITPPLP